MTLSRRHDPLLVANATPTLTANASDLDSAMQAQNAAWDALRLAVAASPSPIDALHRALRAVREGRG